MNAPTLAAHHQIVVGANTILGEKVNKLQAENCRLKCQLARYKAIRSFPGLERFVYEHPELTALECFLHVPDGCDLEEIEVRHVYLRGIELTDRITQAEQDVIAMAYHASLTEAGEDSACALCNGTGEGMHEGASCAVCRGRGH